MALNKRILRLSNMSEKRITNKDVYDSISKLYFVIIGNGDPERGLCFRQAVVERELLRMSNQLDDLSKKVEEHITIIQPLIKPIDKKESWLDSIISSETRDLIVKWGIRLGLMYLVGNEFARNILTGTP